MAQPSRHSHPIEGQNVLAKATHVPIIGSASWRELTSQFASAVEQKLLVGGQQEK